VPSDACIEAMVRSAGREVVARPGYELNVYRPGPALSAGEREALSAEIDAATGRTR
jgi:hypothetical protein